MPFDNYRKFCASKSWTVRDHRGACSREKNRGLLPWKPSTYKYKTQWWTLPPFLSIPVFCFNFTKYFDSPSQHYLTFYFPQRTSGSLLYIITGSAFVSNYFCRARYSEMALITRQNPPKSMCGLGDVSQNLILSQTHRRLFHNFFPYH